MSIARGTNLGEFVVLHEIGRGGMGVVYEAVQQQLGRHVAVKVLPRSALEGVRHRFEREARAAAELQHTNIVQVFAVGSTDDVLYYAMQLITGVPLSTVIRALQTGESITVRQPGAAPLVAETLELGANNGAPEVPAVSAELPPNQVVFPTNRTRVPFLGERGDYFRTVAQLMSDVALAIHFAHQHRIIHRDVKPSNLLISTEGRLYVTDFGIAQLCEEPRVTVAGELVGTPLYMSPEQCMPGDSGVDHRTDIYSLGATLYEFLTLQPVVNGPTCHSIAAQIVHLGPAPPRKVNPHIPRDLETICLKALAKDPKSRYQTAQEFAEDLRRFAEGRPIRAKRVRIGTRAVKWVKRNRLGATSIAIAVLVTASAAFYTQHSVHQMKLRTAKEHAFLAAAGGNFDEALLAVKRAERLGASEGWLEMLRAQVALHQGRYRKAMHHSQRAVELLPDSAAAQAMLAVSWHEHGEWDRYYPKLNQLERFEVETWEDQLYVGLAQSLARPSRGLTMLREAVATQPGSPLARILLARALTEHAVDTGTELDADEAREHARVASSILPENPMIRTVDLLAQLVAIHIYEQGNRTSKRDEALRSAESDMAMLSKLESTLSAEARWARGHFFLQIGDETSALREWHGVSLEASAPSNVIAYYANGLYRSSRAREGIDFLQSLTEYDVTVDIAKAILASDLPEGEKHALDAYRVADERKGSGVVSLYPQTILRLLGRKSEAEAACRKLGEPFLQMPAWMVGWYQQLLDYNLGLITEDRLLEAAGSSRRSQCEAHFFIGITRLADGDREGAASQFQQAVDTGVFQWLDWDYSRSYLARLKADRSWPPWIAVRSP